VISATHGGHWQGEALNKAQALAARQANELKAKKGWRSMTVKAQPVKPDPFWKTVRRDVSENVVVGTFRHRAHPHHLLYRGDHSLRLHRGVSGLRKLAGSGACNRPEPAYLLRA
jgi:hypothetical protein